MKLQELMNDINYWTMGGKHIEGAQNPLAKFQNQMTELFFMTPRTAEEIERFGFSLIQNPAVIDQTPQQCPNLETSVPYFQQQAQQYFTNEYSDSKGKAA